MDPKFVKLEEAAEQLGITTDHLNALREQGKLRAYRDGASWKFRTEEIDGMGSDGVPELDPEDSGINLDFSSLSLGGDKGVDEPVAADEDDLLDLDLSSDDEDEGGFSKIALEDDDDLDLDLSNGSSADLAIDLDDEADVPALADDEEELTLADDTAVEDTPVSATSGNSDLDLELDIESGDDPESILLSEAELGDSDASPSTIIGRAELDDALDLELASDEPKSDPAMSDVRLADLDDLDLDAGATGELPAGGEALVDFDDVEDLGIDLEAESSRILRPEDVAAAQAAAGRQAQQKAPEKSDLELDIDEDYGLAASSSMALGGTSALGGDDDDEIIISGSEINLGDESKASGSGLTGLSALELDTDDDNDDDFVLGDGSDLTLSSADSGINLSPADSGLSLDDAALDLAGSSMTSGIDFGEASGLMSDEPAGDFELTPLGEDLGADDEDDSSQVIALDAFEEQQEADDLLGGGGLGGAAAMPASSAFGQPTMVARTETQFTAWQVVFLTLCLILLSLCGIMAIDVLRSMWSWGEPYQVNSSLIDSLSGFLFP